MKKIILIIVFCFFISAVSQAERIVNKTQTIRQVDLGPIESPIKVTAPEYDFSAEWQKPPEVKSDISGNGLEAVINRVGLVRLSIWVYDAQTKDYKGRSIPSDDKLRAYELVQSPSTSVVQKVTNSIVGMKVGGKRSVLINNLIIEIELLEVAASVGELKHGASEFTAVQPMNGPAENGYVPLPPKPVLQPLSEDHVSRGWKSTEDGIQFKDITVGRGTEAHNGNFIGLNYFVFGYDAQALDMKRSDLRSQKLWPMKTMVVHQAMKKAKDILSKQNNKDDGFDLRVSAIAGGVEGMKVGGQRIVVYDTLYGPEVLEINLLDVDSTMRETAIHNHGSNYETNQLASQQAKAAESARQQAVADKFRSQMSEAYPALVESARAKNKTDPVVMGIVLGEKWHGVQDVNDCRVENWDAKSKIPFCLYDTPSEEDLNSPTWYTCVRVSENNFDTSWLRSSYGDSEPEDDSLGTALVFLMAGMDKSKNCYVDVSVMADNTVGRVSMVTSLLPKDVDLIVKQLTEKYGKHTRYDETWAGFGKTGRLTWELPGLYVVYKEQAENQGGEAFNGGHLEIYTQAWKDFQDEQMRINTKPAL